VRDLAGELGPDAQILMNMCGRGDKDVFSVADALGVAL
jgi:tryptophan synthase beta chain